MKTKIRLIVALVFLFVAAHAYAQTEATGDEKMAAGKYADALADYTKQWATYPLGYPNPTAEIFASRERLLGKMAAVLPKFTKPPIVSDDGELQYQKGVSFMKLAKTPEDFQKAGDAFMAAVNIAPWAFDHWFNMVVARKSGGDFVSALRNAKIAKILAQNDNDRRAALTLRAEIEAAQDMADSAAAKARQEKADAERAETAKAAFARAAEERRKNSIEGYWFYAGNSNFPESTEPWFWIDRVGETLVLKPTSYVSSFRLDLAVRRPTPRQSIAHSTIYKPDRSQ